MYIYIYIIYYKIISKSSINFNSFLNLLKTHKFDIFLKNYIL